MATDEARSTAAVRSFSGAVTGAAILLFAALAAAVLGGVAADAAGHRTLSVALILNIALILFGWFRQRRLARAAAEAGARAATLAERDALTGLLNRNALVIEGAALIRQAAARRGAAAVLMLDLDRFKPVNDAHGRAAGDRLLRLAAAEVQAALPAGALVARLGGDEFACVVPFDPPSDPGERAAADGWAAQIVARLGRPFEADGGALYVGASVGVARSDRDGGDVDALLRAAEIAMYAAKDAGRGRHLWFEPGLEHALRARHEMERDLRAAVAGDELVPFFEQQVELATGRLTGFEVLARWEHPVRGAVPPDRFIPVAEAAGLIGDLSLSLMRRAFLTARDWDAGLTLSVNISAVQLRDAWLAQKIIRTLTETGFAAHRLEVEVTESALFGNTALARSTVASLKNQGIRVALDDFGTGYSSLAHLRALPFDRIKIDRSFVTGLCDRPENAAIVTAIARMGESLNMAVTAEGIEDAATAERLLAMGCERGQGYRYGRPLSAAHARRLLAERQLLSAPAGPRAARPLPFPLRRAG